MRSEPRGRCGRAGEEQSRVSEWAGRESEPWERNKVKGKLSVAREERA